MESKLDSLENRDSGGDTDELGNNCMEVALKISLSDCTALLYSDRSGPNVEY